MKSGVRVAVGDVNGDGILDIVTAPGPGGPGVVKVFRATDGAPEGQFTVPKAQARGGLWVAAGDVEGTGIADIIVVARAGAPLVQVFRGSTGQPVTSFRADAGTARGTWRGGAKVATGDLDRDGHVDIVTVPVVGRPVVRVFGGVTGAVIASYRAFDRPVAGGASIAVGSLDAGRRLDVVVAAPGANDSARVRVLDGLTGAAISAFRTAGRGFAGGVNVGTLNFGGRTGDELALAPGRARGAGATVLDTSPLRFTRGVGAAGGAPTVAYRLPASPGAPSSPAPVRWPTRPRPSRRQAPSPRCRCRSRRSSGWRSTTPPRGTFQPVQPGDSRLAGKDITVIVHGWAPGYLDWVNYEASKGHVLKWWETFPGQPGYDPPPKNPGPDSDWLLQGGPPGTTPAAGTGLAQAIAERRFLGTGAPEDTNAVVLAYSWIDDSATPAWDFLHFQVPEDADLSEARTTLNGVRLASALGTVLGSSTAAAAEIQLVGHSHGSKVATVAAGALAGAGYPLRQLTILDSPEASGSLQGEGVVEDGAANFNWFFLQDLTLNRQTASAPFVDNYISYFDAPYGGITSNGTVTLPSDLNQVVDVSLYPDSIDVIDLGDKHSYAAWWYTGSGDPTLNGNQPSGVGQYWSPMLPANGGSSSPVPGLSPYYQQDWSILSHPASTQFVLDAQSSSPAQNYTFTSAGVGTTTLQQANTTTQQQVVSFRRRSTATRGSRSTTSSRPSPPATC